MVGKGDPVTDLIATLPRRPLRTSDALAALLPRLDPGPLVIVTGGDSAQTPAIAALIAGLCAVRLKARVVPQSGPLPCIETVPEARPGEAIIAIGGGKTLDSAKVMSLGLRRTDLHARLVNGNTDWTRRHPLICLPTTAGSGSEATQFAVCYLAGAKHSINHPTLRPDLAVLCPPLLAGLAPRQAAISGLDMLCQSTESLFSRKATDASRHWAFGALHIGLPLMRAGPERDPERMLLAAHLSGCAINVARTNLPHALSYHLTARHGVPHGLAVALYHDTYLSWLDARRADLSSRQAADLAQICTLLGGAPRYRTGSWTALLLSAGLTAKLSDLAVDADALAASVNVERLDNFVLPVDLPAFVAQAIAQKAAP